jgi:hypothetical protein
LREPSRGERPVVDCPPLVGRLRELALSALARMYRAEAGLFVFRVRHTPAGVVGEGLSPRYTAIAAIGLAGERPAAADAVLGGGTLKDLCAALIRRSSSSENLGDVALTLWAARAAGLAERGSAWQRLVTLCGDDRPASAVETAWALAALSLDREAPVGALRERLAGRLLAAQGRSGLFPHVPGGRGLRSHVCCFADVVYPIHALALYYEMSGAPDARASALRAAETVAALQGPDGQWWWHYDVRTGRIVEHYPVYAVHQDAMAPMAFAALARALGVRFDGAVRKGLDWLAAAPELQGASLVDDAAGLVWRKVGRREPGKLARSLQAGTSRLHPRLRVVGLDTVLPPRVIDYEDRPYHLGWILHAWPDPRDRDPRAA